jgi:hypothetical protein
MKISMVHCHALSICVVAAMLPGCGGSQPPVGATRTMPQTSAIAPHVGRGKSWMKPEAKGEDLLYISDGYGVKAYTYPGLKLVGNLTGFSKYANLGTLCSDGHGDIFVPSWLTNQFTGEIYEFAHGGTSPIATLDDPGGGYGCSVDPTTGNLAVTNILAPDPPYKYGNVAIYPNARGNPTVYDSPYINSYWYAAYDDNGDLFVDGEGYGASGFPLAELLSGASSFSDITLNRELNPYSLQWSNGHLIIASDAGCRCVGPEYIYEIQVSGDYGTVIHTTALKSHPNRNAEAAQFWIQENRIVGAGGRDGDNNVQIWHYPRSGGPIKVRSRVALYGVIVSVAPPRLRMLP